MLKSNRRILRTTAAVVGMTAVGAVGTGTAFADSLTDLDRPTEGLGQADPTGATDGLGTEEVGGTDLHSFELPSLGDQTVRNHPSKKKDKDSDDEDSDKDKDSDDKDSDDKDSDDGDKDSDDDGDSKKDKKKSGSSKKKDKDSDDEDDDDRGGKHRKKNDD